LKGEDTAMTEYIASFCAILFTAPALILAAAHVLELPNTRSLPQQNYFLVQHLYRDWRFVEIIVVAALISTIALSVVTRSSERDRT
jgi:hypothetical protein